MTARPTGFGARVYRRSPALHTALVVEDEADIARLVRRYLEREGFRVEVASDGVQALEQFARRPRSGSCWRSSQASRATC